MPSLETDPEVNGPLAVPERKIIPAVRTLNSKLTGRRAVRPSAPPVEDLAGEGDSSEDETYTTYTNSENGSVPGTSRSDIESIVTKNDNKKDKDVMVVQKMGNNRVKHWGKYHKREYNVGRVVPHTGMWDCCGDETELSLYCLSKKEVKAYRARVDARRRVLEAEKLYREKKLKEVKAPWDERQKRRLLRNMAAEKAQHGDPFSFGKKENDTGEVGRDGDFGSDSEADEDLGPSAEDKAMAFAESTESSFNAPMLCSWLYKNVTEEPTVTSGLAFLQEHLNSGEGCQLMLKHGIFDSIEKIHNHFRDHAFLQLQCVIALRKLLDCNFTRDQLIQADPRALRLAFSIGHVHMKSHKHIDECARCVCQCARSEYCRRDIMTRRVYLYISNICKRFVNHASILRFSLKFFNWTATTNERIAELSDAGVTAVIITVMKRHQGNAGVLAPGMLFLTRAAASHPPAMATILQMKATPSIIKALMALYSDEVLQLEGLKMVQTISKTREGWRQISETKGGWQSLTQGTNLGNALVHDLPGALHNPGWAIGDTPHMPHMEKNKMKATETFLAKSRGAVSKASWTAHGLKDFMGISMKETKLKVNTEYHDTYFELLTTLELLPEPGEEREFWFMRLKEYEHSNHIELEEMVLTMMELKKKEERKEKAKAAQALLPTEDRSKAVYVGGRLVTTKMLDEADATIEELMLGTDVAPKDPDADD